MTIRLILLAASCHLIASHGFDIWYGEAVWLTESGQCDGGAPLFTLLLQGLQNLSRSEIVLRLPCLAACLATVLLIYRLSRKCLGGDGAVEAGIVAAASPILCSAGWEVHPCALDLLAAAFWLNAFVALLDGVRPRQWIVLATAAAAAVMLNPWMSLLALPQLVILVLAFNRTRRLLLGSVCSLLPAAGVVVLLALGSGGETKSDRGSATHAATLGGYDVGYVMTDISLGRLHSWTPLTPAITMAPSGFEAPSVQGRTIGSPEEARLPWFLQGMQLLFFGLCSITAVLAFLSVWNIRTYTLPGNVEAGGRRKQRRSRLDQIVAEAVASRKRGVLLLLLSVIVPPAACFLFPLGLQGLFPEQRLLFIAVPWLVLVGRGLASLEWKAARYALLVPMVAVALFYLLSSISLQEALHGAKDAARSVEQEWQEGDAVDVDRLVEPVLAWYAGVDLVEDSARLKSPKRLWEIRFAPREDSSSARIPGYLAGVGLRARRKEEMPSFFSDNESCNGEGRLFDQYRVTLWTP